MSMASEAEEVPSAAAKRKDKGDSSSDPSNRESKMRRTYKQFNPNDSRIAARNARIAAIENPPKPLDLDAIDHFDLYRRYEGEITIDQAKTMLSEMRKDRIRLREEMGFVADINPVFLWPHCAVDSPELPALKNKNYMNLAILAIATYNKKNNTRFEVQQLEKVEKVINVPCSLSDIAYNLTFTGNDVKAGGCDLTATCHTFQAYVEVDVFDEVGGKKVEYCRLKA